MRLFQRIAILFVSLFAACTPTATPVPVAVATMPPPVATSAVMPSGTDRPAQTYALKDVSMTLERTPCFGTCPDYTVTVMGDGSVNYQGTNFVAVKGAQHRQIPQSVVTELLRQFYVLDFFSMRSEYIEGRDISVETDGTVKEIHSMVTDLPTTIVTLRIGTYTKRVQAYFQAPDALYTIAKDIDETAGTAEWVRLP